MPTCPVCGYPGLEEPPRSASGGGSYEICPSCGFQFGVDDDDKGITHEEWRARWMEKGTPWSSRGIEKPKGWDVKAQLAAVTKPARTAMPKRIAKTVSPNVSKSAKGAKASTSSSSSRAAKSSKPSKPHLRSSPKRRRRDSE